MAGLPNIRGTLGNIYNRNIEARYSGFETYTGAFTSNTRTAKIGYFTNTADGTSGAAVVNFNASSSNPIYGKSTTVTPLSLSAILIIKY